MSPCRPIDWPVIHRVRVIVYLPLRLTLLPVLLPASLEVARRQERWQLRLAASSAHSPCHAFGRLQQPAKVRKNAAPRGTNLQELWKGALKTQRRSLPAPDRLLPAGLSWPSKEEQLRVVERLQAEVPLGTAVLYTDGSKARGREEAGWAVSVWKNGTEVEAVSGKLGRAEVFDAEVVALAVALDVAAAERRALVLSDSQAAVSAVVCDSGWAGRPVGPALPGRYKSAASLQGFDVA